MSQVFEGTRRFYLAFHQWNRLCRPSAHRQCPVQHHLRDHHSGVARTRTRYVNHQRSLRRFATRAEQYEASSGTDDQDRTKEQSTDTDFQHERNVKGSPSPITAKAQRWHFGQSHHESGGRSGTDMTTHDSGTERGYKEASIRAYREALAGMANPVVVLTTWDVDAASKDPDGPSDNRWHGVTLSSFTSLCLHPEPHITFNINVHSRTLAALRRQTSPRICIHILKATAKAAEIADTFAKRYDRSEEPFEILAQKGATIGLQNSSPYVRWRQAVRAWVFCSTDTDCVVKTVGDHHICVFRVDSIDHGEFSGKTLGYTRGQYVEAAPLRSIIDSDVDKRRQHLDPDVQNTERPDRPSAPSALDLQKRPTVSSRGQRRSLSKSAGSHARRDYSTSHMAEQTEGDDKTAHDIKVNPAILKETVEDFLCLPRDRFPHRFNRLMNIKGDADYLQAALEEMEDSGSGRQRGELQLKTAIIQRRRYVARQLALHAAHDLESMLDHARVSRSRVQYMESCIERGHAALIEEGRELKQKIERCKIEGRNTDEVQTRLVNTSKLLQEEEKVRTVLLRLRDFFDEDERGDFLDNDDN